MGHDVPATMTAVRWHGPRDIRDERVPRPAAAGPGELLIAVDACGVCGTDIEEWQHGPINIAVDRHPLTGRQAPLTLGHEFCGTVLAAGEGASTAVGARVAVEVNISCGTCARCIAGDTQLCPSLGSLGLHGDGGLAELVVVPEPVCVPLPDDLPPRRAVLAEPLAVAIRAMRLAGVRAGETVLVLGGGTIGQLAARLVVRAGARALLVEPHPSRRHVAERAGIPTATPDEPPGDADVTLECAGYPGSVADAAAATRPGGRIAVLGVSTHQLGLTAWDVIRREQHILGVLSHTLADFTAAVRTLADGDIDVSGIVTDLVPLSNAIEGAFVPLRDAPADHLKIVVVPD